MAFIIYLKNYRMHHVRMKIHASKAVLKFTGVANVKRIHCNSQAYYKSTQEKIDLISSPYLLITSVTLTSQKKAYL